MYKVFEILNKKKCVQGRLEMEGFRGIDCNCYLRDQLGG